MSVSDIVLLERWRTDRDAEAFAELVSRHASLVYATCKRVLGNAAEAEDVAQECFVELMGGETKVRRSLPALLHRMALHRSLDRIKTEGRRRHRERRFAENSSEHVELDVDDVLAHVDEAIAALPEKLRAPIVLRFLEGQTHAAIAETMGGAESTVRHRINQGIEEVRTFLKEKGVVVGAAALAALMEERLCEAAPAALTAALGKLSLAGTRAAGSLASVQKGAMAARSVGSATGTKWLAIAAGSVLVAGVAIWGVTKAIQGQDGGRNILSAPGSARVSIGRPGTDAANGPDESSQGDVSAEQDPAGAGGGGQVASAEKGIVSGRLYDKLNGEGIEGVRVSVYPPGGGRQVARSEPSDTDGRYRLTGLADGAHSISIPRIRQFPETARGISRVVTIEEGRAVKDTDFALRRGIRVAGKVTAAVGKPAAGAMVHGKTKDMPNAMWAESGDDGFFDLYFPMPSDVLLLEAKTEEFVSDIPEGLALPKQGIENVELPLTIPRNCSVAGSVVAASGRPMEKVQVHLVRESGLVGTEGQAETAGNGSFRVIGLREGEYGVRLVPPGVRSFISTDFAARVDLAPGEVVRGMRLVFGEKGGLAIAGKVVDTGGAPIAGAQVHCFGPSQETAHVAQDGTFRITGLVDGTYSVQAEHFDYTTAACTATAGSADVVLVMRGKAAIEGRVVRADTGAPLTEFEVAYINGSGPRVRSQIFSNSRDVRDSEGRFAFSEVYVGEVTVAARAPGFAPAAKALVLDEHETADGIELALQPAQPFRGKVVNGSGEPVSDAFVFTEGRSHTTQHVAGQTPARTAMDGTFALEGLWPDTEVVTAYHPDYGPGSVRIAESSEIVLRDPGAVEGVVFEEGVPLGEASVYVHYEAERELPYTYAAVAEDGRYRITGLAPGRVEVRAHHGGQFSRSIKREGIVHSGQATQVDLEFRSGTSALAGRVTVNGTPPEIAVLYLSIETEAGQDGSQARAESDGSYEFLGLPPGRAELIVHVAKAADTVDPQRHTFDIEIPEGARIEKNIELSE